MTATAHALVAGAIASKFQDPAAAAGLALVSHYVMDSIPHWDFGTNWRLRPKTVTGAAAIAETLFAVAVTFGLYTRSASLPALAAGVLASLLPDWIETPWYIFFASPKKKEPAVRAGWGEKLCYRIYKLQNGFHAKAQLPMGLVTQVVTVWFFLFLLR